MLIIAPNHQNALIDALALVCNTPFQHVFMARADIFKGKRMVKFLTYLNIMPIYRIRDGIENVKRNDEVFDKTTQVIHNRNNPLVLFAEGNHGDKRRLRPLVKGLFRIAFQAQDKYGAGKGVKIVPMGIDYGHYQNFRSTLYMNMGEPIEVSDFYPEYAENPVQAINRFKDVYAEKMSGLMIDIQTEEFYDLYMNMRSIYNDRMAEHLGIHEKNLASKFRADKEMITRLDKELENHPAGIQQLNELVAGYLADIKKSGLRDWILHEGATGSMKILGSLLAKIVLLPVFLFGFIHNILPYWFTGSRAANIKDPQFISSIKLVTGLLVFPVWYIIVTGILAFLSVPLWVIAVYLVSMPLTGIVAFDYFIGVKKLTGQLRFLSLPAKRKENLINQRAAILNSMDKIMHFHNNSNENSR